jgi:hypothetical protein
MIGSESTLDWTLDSKQIWTLNSGVYMMLILALASRTFTYQQKLVILQAQFSIHSCQLEASLDHNASWLS